MHTHITSINGFKHVLIFEIKYEDASTLYVIIVLLYEVYLPCNNQTKFHKGASSNLYPSLKFYVFIYLTGHY